MKQQIKEIQKYFLNKILKKEYEILEIDKHTISLSIDKDYNFCIWVANNDYGIKQYCGFSSNENFIYLGNITVKQKQKIWSNLKLLVKKHNEEVILKEKKEQFEKLKAELNL